MSTARESRSLGLLWTVTLLVVGVATASASEMGQAAADQVSEDMIRYYLGEASGYEGILFTHVWQDRDGGGGAHHDAARGNIEAQLSAFGLGVSEHEYAIPWQESGVNVVAEQLGTVYPDSIIVIGAHYDSVRNPGANDNATGVTALLECARILSQYECDSTIRYIAFDDEEKGCDGSQAYVADHVTDDFVAMISVDQIGYEPDPPTNQAALWGEPDDVPTDQLKAAVAAAISAYSGGLTAVLPAENQFSDHDSFESVCPAIALSEGNAAGGCTPRVHEDLDTVDLPDYIDTAYVAKITRGLVGYVVDAAGVQVETDALRCVYWYRRPEHVWPQGGPPLRMQVEAVGQATLDSVTVHYRVDSQWYSVSATEVDAQNDVYDVIFNPPAASERDFEYYVELDGFVDGVPQAFRDPWNAPTDTYKATVAYGREVFFDERFGTNPGWTTEGDWAWGTPLGLGGTWGGPDPTSGHTGTDVYGYNLSGDYGAIAAPGHHLTTPAINCSGRQSVALRFWRWLGVGSQVEGGHATLCMSTDAQSWEDLRENLCMIDDGGADTCGQGQGQWVPVRIPLSEDADDQPTVYLRWTMGPTTGSYPYCGWNIDDVELSAQRCAAYLVGDLNCDGLLNAFDLDPFVLALGSAGQTPPFHSYVLEYPECDPMLADINEDGLVNAFDIDPFVLLISGGGREGGAAKDRGGPRPVEVAVLLRMHVAPERLPVVITAAARLAEACADTPTGHFWRAVLAELLRWA